MQTIVCCIYLHIYMYTFICGCIIYNINIKVIFIFISFKQELVTCAHWYAEVSAKPSHSCYLNVHKLKKEARRTDWWIIRLVVKPCYPFELSGSICCQKFSSHSQPRKIEQLVNAVTPPVQHNEKDLCNQGFRIASRWAPWWKDRQNFNCLGSMKCKVLRIKHLIFGLLL